MRRISTLVAILILATQAPAGAQDHPLNPATTFTTVTQGGWHSTPHGNNPGSILAANFGSLYPSGVTIGSGFTMTFTSAAAIRAYLPAGGTPGALTASLVNPLTSPSGVFGGQVLALRLNVDFSAAGLLPGGSFGSLTLTGTGTSLDGSTVSAILAAANTALGGGALPAGYTLADLNELVTNLNEAYNGGLPSDWAVAHLM